MRNTDPTLPTSPARRDFLAAALAASAAAATAAGAEAGPRLLPEFPTNAAGDWINSPALRTQDLRRRPVLIEFWTFGCYNCRNTLPWLKQVHAQYAPRGLSVIAVHTPEFAAERQPAAVRAAVQRLEITYPVMLDPDSRYWQALGNRYWPAFYLFDRAHVLVGTRIGELHRGNRGAEEFERAIIRALA